jgi:hypothetical protein
LAHLAQANRQIGELAVQIAAQRAIVKHALDTGQGSEMAESLLDALQASLRIFEKHRIFLLSCSGSSSALPPGDAAMGRSLSRRNGYGASFPESRIRADGNSFGGQDWLLKKGHKYAHALE